MTLLTPQLWISEHRNYESLNTATMNLFGPAFAVSQGGNLVSALDPTSPWKLVKFWLVNQQLSLNYKVHVYFLRAP